MYTTRLLDNRNRAHLDETADLIAQGEIVAFGFSGIFVFIGDADQRIAARRIAVAKRQPLDKPLVLICAPECLDEFVDLAAPAFRYHPFGVLQQLQRQVYCLGMILPAARAGVPAYMNHNRTILNVWMEYPPHEPARYLQAQIRKRGARAFLGSSTNQHGQATYVDAQHTLSVFGGTIPAIVNHDLSRVPAQYRQSSTLVDFTGEFPRLVRRGSLPIEELRFQLKRFGLRRLLIEEPVAQT
jgi:tRNA A37 threonylcarbamoyladenosine synthetase subunit TsaC/SUA5/YrdC